MHYTSPKLHTARKAKGCTFCGETIEKGERYAQWYSFNEEKFTHSLRLECQEALENGEVDVGDEFDYVPYKNQRPRNSL